MLEIIVITSLVIGTAYADVLPQNCGKSLNPSLIDWRIINGNDAKVGEFPWFSMISLANPDPKHPSGNDFCGGTIINDKWVLTAAHCLMFVNKIPIKVRLGIHNMSLHEKSEIDINIEKSFMHDKWDPAHILNDIALLKLKDSIDFNGKHKHLRPICLARNNTKLTNKCDAYGFGTVNATRGESPKNGILKKIDQRITDPSICKKFDHLLHEETEICVMSESGRSICDGDSGGPMQCQGEDGLSYQVGVVSYGSDPCGDPNTTSTYTKVSAYVQWIENTIKNNSV